jgi:hypothetical protein
MKPNQDELMDVYFERACRVLVECRGHDRAITINDLMARAGINSRRVCEKILETRLQDFPFPLASGSDGYFIPTQSEDINHYLDSLESRAICLFHRKKNVIHKALAAGFRRVGKRFQNPPSSQPELALKW